MTQSFDKQHHLGEDGSLDPEKLKDAENKILTDDQSAKALVTFKEHFQAKLWRETMINNTAFVIGGGLSTFVLS